MDCYIFRPNDKIMLLSSIILFHNQYIFFLYDYIHFHPYYRAMFRRKHTPTHTHTHVSSLAHFQQRGNLTCPHPQSPASIFSSLHLPAQHSRNATVMRQRISAESPLQNNEKTIHTLSRALPWNAWNRLHSSQQRQTLAGHWSYLRMYHFYLWFGEIVFGERTFEIQNHNELYLLASL